MAVGITRELTSSSMNRKQRILEMESFETSKAYITSKEAILSNPSETVLTTGEGVCKHEPMGLSHSSYYIHLLAPLCSPQLTIL